VSEKAAPKVEQKKSNLSSSESQLQSKNTSLKKELSEKTIPQQPSVIVKQNDVKEGEEDVEMSELEPSKPLSDPASNTPQGKAVSSACDNDDDDENADTEPDEALDILKKTEKETEIEQSPAKKQKLEEEQSTNEFEKTTNSFIEPV
jgi:hypothetical protein